MSKVVMSEIIDNVYFQKLGVIITHLQFWEASKRQVLGEVYSECVGQTFQRMERNHVELRSQIGQFSKVINGQYAFLGRVRKQERTCAISQSFGEFREFVEGFEPIKQGLINLADFMGKFIEATNNGFGELKKLYAQTSELKSEYEEYVLKANQTFSQKKELICSKKNIRKHFQLSKILGLIVDLEKDKQYRNELSFKLHALTLREVNTKLKMYRDICESLQYVSGLYQKCFGRDFLGKVRPYFRQRLQEMEGEKDRLSRLTLDTSKTDCAYKQLSDQFYGIFDQFLNEITIARWRVLFADRSKHSEVKCETERNVNLILTFDNKILFYNRQEKDISLQVSLDDLKVNKPTPDGLIEFKHRKSKDKFLIQFGTVEKEDEFYLHYQQIAQLT